MPIDPRIAMGFQPTTQLESPLNRLAKFQQIESGQRANELANMQMQEYERGLQEQEGLRNYLAGSPDLASPKGQSELMRHGQAGAKFAKTMDERASEQAKLRETQAKTESSQFDLSRKRLAAGYQAVSSAKNAADVMAALDEGVQLGYFTQQQADAQKSELAALQTIPEFQKWQQGKLQGLMSAKDQLEMMVPKPGPKTDLARLIEEQKQFQLGTPEYSLYQQAIAKATKPSQGVQVNVSTGTEKKYGERFGSIVAESDAAKLAAAESAPQVAATSDRVLDILESGKVITGTGADFRLQLAKALNLAGNTDAERIRNTELLGSSLADTTLGAIKTSNLGTGQGFTDRDRQFLEKAKAGQITFDAGSLKELARLSRLAAEKSVESWNKRVQKMPSSALEGTGISTDPIVLPKRKEPKTSIPAAAIQALQTGQGTPEQFDAIFGAGSASKILGKGK